MVDNRHDGPDATRRNYLKGLGAAVSLGLAAGSGGAAAADADRFTSDLGEIEDATLAASDSEDAILVESAATPVAPGIELSSVTRLDERGWIEADVLVAEMDDESTDASLLSPGVTGRETVSTLAEGDGSVAGVNGDFFDIGNTDAPLGVEVEAGDLRKSPAPGREHAVGVGADGLARLARLALDGAVSVGDDAHPLAALNHAAVPADGIGLYTSVWGDASRAGVVGDAARVREVAVRDGVVAATTPAPGSGAIPDDGYVLVGRGAGADALAGLSKGDEVSVSYEPRTDGASPLDVAIGGGTVLLRDGELPAGLDDERLEPRTAAGVSADGARLYLLAVDGRQRDSRGAGLRELGALLRELGASDALNLDGGGSTALVARDPGEDDLRVRNDPSDGAERPVSNGLGLSTAPGSGRLDGFGVESVLAGENGHRVFPGLSREFAAKAHDETYAPVDAEPTTWQAVPGRLGRFDDDGRFAARKTGRGDARARRRGTVGETRLRVLGDLDRLETDPGRIGLEPDGNAEFSVLGFDSRGYAAPVAPREADLDYDDSLLAIEATDEGTFRVAPTGESGSTLVTVSVLDEAAYLPVSVGLDTADVSGFEDPSAWYYAEWPPEVEGSMSFVEGRTGRGLRLDYDFMTTEATRAAYARCEERVELPGEPQALGVWVNGDGQGAWLRGVVYDAAGVSHPLDFTDSVDWTGWQYVEAAIPDGVEYPLEFSHLYPVEASSDEQYAGSLVFDDLSVEVTPSLDVPETPTRPDPLVVRNDALDDDRWTFAVLADSQFVAANPDSLAVELARRTLREVVAADPEFLVIAGDFVDTGYPEDFELARRLLREEVGDAFPVYYVPGNHELMGTDSLANFEAVFEDARYEFDHRGTRFFLLNSATGSFRTSEFEQLVELQAGLREAADDDAVENVVVVAHHPTRDPLATGNSQLGDRMEAELIEEWLTAFRERSGGKGAVYMAGHAGTANVARVEGVPHVTLSTTGKDPYGPADDGGFRQWALFGVGGSGDSETGGGAEEAGEDGEDDFPTVRQSDWLRAEVRPLLTGIDLDAPESLAVGEHATVSATGVQDAGLTFPLEYPATVRWEGSDDLLVAPAAERDEDWNERDGAEGYVAAFDPETGSLVGLRAGTATLRVESNGTTAEVAVSVEESD